MLEFTIVYFNLFCHVISLSIENIIYMLKLLILKYN